MEFLVNLLVLNKKYGEQNLFILQNRSAYIFQLFLHQNIIIMFK
jgi:hypothetical protein